jgi:acetyltransferase-like isoleucine patch superfamily enzyme
MNFTKKLLSLPSKRQIFIVILKFVYSRIYLYSTTFINRIILFLWNAKVGKKFYSNGLLRIYNLGQIIIGEHVSINSGSVQNFIGGSVKTAFWISKNATLRIGNNVGLSGTTIVCLDEVLIGDYVKIGGGAIIIDSDIHPLKSSNPVNKEAILIKKEKITIGKNAFIGANSIILKGSKIGESSVIGAGSVVAGSIPDNQIWAGNPARFIRDIL